MSDPILIAAISATAALVGALVGSTFSVVIVWFNRRWAKEDARRAAHIEITERRCKQSEDYAAAVTADTYEIRHAIHFLNGIEDPVLAKDRTQTRAEARDNVDKIIYASGPAIRSLGDEGLTEAFTDMADAWDEIADVYRKLMQDKFDVGKQVDSEKVSKDSAQATKHFATGLAKFYSRLDAIREAAAS